MSCEQQKPEWWRPPVSPGQAVHWGNCSRDRCSVVSMPDRYLDALIWAHSTYIALTDPEMSRPARTLEGVSNDISKRGCSATERCYYYTKVYAWSLDSSFVGLQFTVETAVPWSSCCKHVLKECTMDFSQWILRSILELRKMTEYLRSLRSSESLLIAGAEKVWLQ